jgi:hypothetical protein
MSGRMLIALAAVTLGLGVTACERLATPQKPAATLTPEPMPFVDAIPAEFGSLVSVTVDSARPHSVQLWFQKPDQTVVMVYADYRNHFISPTCLVFPRR